MKNFLNTFSEETEQNGQFDKPDQPKKKKKHPSSSEALLVGSDSEEVDRSSDLGQGNYFESSVDIKFSPSITRPSTIGNQEAQPMGQITK